MNKKSAKTQQDTQKCDSNKHWTWTSKPTNMPHFWLDFTDSLTCIALVWLYHQWCTNHYIYEETVDFSVAQ